MAQEIKPFIVRIFSKETAQPSALTVKTTTVTGLLSDYPTEEIPIYFSKDLKTYKDPIYDYGGKIVTPMTEMERDGIFIFIYRIYRLITEKRLNNIVATVHPFDIPPTEYEMEELNKTVLRKANSELDMWLSTKKDNCCIEIGVKSKSLSREQIETNIIPSIIRYYDENGKESFIFLLNVTNSVKMQNLKLDNK